MVRAILFVVASLALAAHHLRAGQEGLVLFWLLAPTLMTINRRFVPWVIAATQIAGAGIWVHTGWQIMLQRQVMHLPGTRAGLIMASVAGISLFVAVLFLRRSSRERYGDAKEALLAPLIAAAITASLLAFVLLRVPASAILLERFLVGAGWLQVLWMAVYAAWLTSVVLVPKQARTWRPRIWVLFSLVFYGQLTLGLLGIERFLMSGNLHLPIPAIIAAGPAFRGHGFFMLILFASSVVFVGPAWCSWLCYLGGWDNLAALQQRWAGTLPPWRKHLRLGILIGVVGLAVLLGLLGVPGSIAAALGGLFGIVGIAIMATLSRQRGVMVHCTAYCPIGWLATRVGKLNPFRIVIDQSCTECMACTRFCRFDALSEQNIKERKVGPSCTLCGDCVTVCQKTTDIHYAFPGLSPERARVVFLVLAVAMHASFMGIAMI